MTSARQPMAPLAAEWMRLEQAAEALRQQRADHARRCWQSGWDPAFIRRSVAQSAGRQECSAARRSIGPEEPMPPRLKLLCGRAAAMFGVPVEQLMPLRGRSRRNHVVRARQALLHVLLTEGRHSAARLGRMFGFDHTTVLHARNRCAEAMQADPDYRELVQALASSLTQQVPHEQA